MNGAERAGSEAIQAFFTSCSKGEMAAVREQLDRRPELVLERHQGTTALHLAVRHPEVVRLLLERGADPNARDEGDNALPLHFAAGGAPLESVRALLEAGSDPQGSGDLHRLDVIGWATVFAGARRDVVDLLVEHGARHHAFSAIALGDLELLRRLTEEDPEALRRRLSRFEQEQTVLHYVTAPPDGLVGGMFRTGDHYRTLELLIELGADLEARDARDRTPLAVAMLRGDRTAMRLLHAAGAREPELPPESSSGPPPAPGKVRISPMLSVLDMEATVAWYRSIGFELAGSHGDEGAMDWAAVVLGDVEIMFVPSTDPWRESTRSLDLWIYTDRLDELYGLLKRRQLQRARAFLAGDEPEGPEVPFTLDLHTAFYGQREFGVRDPNGINLLFAQPLEPES